MLRSLYSAASGMEAQERRMDTISHNLANTNTTGFKKQRADFEDVLYETVKSAGAPSQNGGVSVAPLQVGLGVRNVATTRSQAQGDLLTTQNPYDVAIEGNGFFRVIKPSGEFAYTRAGNFRVDGMGRLVTQRGEQLDGNISVPVEAQQISITADGTVSARMPGKDEMQELGRLELTLFTNPAGLEANGGNTYTATEAAGQAMQVRPGEAGAGSLAQGFLENSNVKAVEEMVDLIGTQRAYELNSKVIQTADQMLNRLTNLR
ncbi:MAG: flagellar basal-body rod protein FlgG [Myxococcaceae bacterium]|nr:flagellar basal-body rod protein FlgG [Myxococcaceae bacterium]